MNQQKKQRLQQTACQIRMDIIEEVFHAHSGHPGGSLSITDILTYLYFEEMKIYPNDPQNSLRDRFVLSKGHCAPALYAVLANRGYFDKKELLSLRKCGALLQGHPDMKHIPGVDMTSGSLGQGISAACGMAKSGKLQDLHYRVYCALGDGEIEEGQVWEAFMFAAYHKLDNLCVVIDNNHLQIDGPISEVCSPYPINEKMKAFGFFVQEIDAHDFAQIEEAFEHARQQKGKPSVIIAKSVKGKGVSFMENQVQWHGTAPNEEQYQQAIQELNQQMACIKKEAE